MGDHDAARVTLDSIIGDDSHDKDLIFVFVQARGPPPESINV